MLPKGLPQYTIGYGVLDWCTEYLSQPNTSVNKAKGDIWEFMDDQAFFIVWFYAVDKNGNWLYNEAYRERAKGTGKSPMVAALACAELMGPTMFSHFECEHGEFKSAHCEDSVAVGKQNPNSLVWFSAISEEGSKHTYKFACAMLEGRAEEYYNLEIGMTKVLYRGPHGLREMRVVTASAKSREGPSPTFCVKEETQNWTPAGDGDELNEAIDRGLGKTNGRAIQVTNAPAPGQGSIAEGVHKHQQAIEAGRAANKKLLFDTFMIRVEDIKDPKQAMPALRIMYKDAPWINLDRIMDEIQNPNHREVNSRRFYFNEMVNPVEMWISERDWDDAKDEKLRLHRDDQISIGVRVVKDCAVVAATRLHDKAVFILEIWEKPEDADRFWEVPYGIIDRRVRKILDTHNVYNLYASPERIETIVSHWFAEYEDYVFIEEFWLSRNKQKNAAAVMAFEAAVLDKRLKHTGDGTLKRHVMNCFINEIPQGIILRQEFPNSKRYIAAAEAAVLSLQAALDAIEDGALKEKPGGIMYMY